MGRETRTNLLDSAQRRFSIDGYAGTSIRDLAADVGIKESSVYKHFPSKQALLEAVLVRANDRVLEVAARFGVPVDDPEAAVPAYAAISPERLTEIAEGFLDMWLRDRDFVAVRRLLMLEQYRTPAAGQMLRDLLVEGALTFQTPLFAELIRLGVFRPAEPGAVALAFWGPILAILMAADVPEDEPLARRRLHAHLDHFRSTHATDPEEES